MNTKINFFLNVSCTFLLIPKQLLFHNFSFYLDFLFINFLGKKFIAIRKGLLGHKARPCKYRTVTQNLVPCVLTISF